MVIKRRVFVIICVCIITTIAFAFFFYENAKGTKKMRIGYSYVDITPPVGVELCGYGYYPGRKAERINDPLFVRAVLFDDGKKKLLLLNCDLIALSQQIVDEVKQKIKDDLGIDKNHILILSTHTHTGPNTCDAEGIGERDENYVKILPSLMVEAGNSAYKNTRRVKSVKQVKTALEEKIGYNRTNPDIPSDEELRAIAFYFEKGNPLAILSTGCHPVTLGPAKVISADYPGCVTNEMEKAGYDSVFLNGFCGDIDPVSNIFRWGAGTQETIDEYGEIIAGTFLNAVQETEMVKDMAIDSFEIPVKLNLVEYKNEDIDRILKDYSGDKDLNPAKYRLVQSWASKMKEHIGNSENPYEKTLNVQVFQLGGVVLVGFPAEMFFSLAAPLKDALPDKIVMALGNANASTGYIATVKTIENLGYEGYESNFLYLSLPLEPGEGERLAATVAEQLKLNIYK